MKPFLERAAFFTAVPITASHLEGTPATEDIRVSDLGLDTFKNLYAAAAGVAILGPLIRNADGDFASPPLLADLVMQQVMSGDSARLLKQLLTAPRVFTTTADEPSEKAKEELKDLLHEHNCVVLEMEIARYWRFLLNECGVQPHKLLPAFKGVSDDGYPDDMDNEMGEAESRRIRGENRVKATRSAAVAMLCYVEARFLM
jgi:hypothetical protein